jgi:enoyl-CoA hydratase/carnithine racemase
MSDYNTLTFDTPQDGIALMTFNRPDSLNAITWEMVEEIHDVLSRMEQKTDLRVLIMTGAGRGFCSGTDLKSGRSKDQNASPPGAAAQMRKQRRIADIPIHMRKIPQPIIAAVNGVAAGGGFSFAMAADMRIASPNVRFIASYINIGLSACEIGSSYFLPRLVGVSRASEILYTGREVWAEEAERIGLISRIVEEGEVLAAAMDLAHTMLSKSPFGLAMTKEVLNHSIDAPTLESAVYMENRTQTLAVMTGDVGEAILAFQEKRPPVYKGE